MFFAKRVACLFAVADLLLLMCAAYRRFISNKYAHDSHTNPFLSVSFKKFVYKLIVYKMDLKTLALCDIITPVNL